MLGSTPAARLSAWREWREAADLDQLTHEEFQTIPCLGRDLLEWLAVDPAAGILRGMLRRAWTENQIRLKALGTVIATLEAAGCDPVLAGGSAAIALGRRHEGSVRPVYDLRVVTPRGQIAQAAAALESAGWSASSPLPEPNHLDYVPAVHFSRGELHLILQWRLLAAPPGVAAACEAEVLEHAQTVNYGAGKVRIPGPEHLLLTALCGRLPYDADPIHWAVDAAMLPADGIDWKRWTAAADAWAPEAFDRLDWMREAGWKVPRVARPMKPVKQVRRRGPLEAAYWRWRGRAGKLLRRMGLR